MRLGELFNPVSLDELKGEYFGKQCLLVKRKKSNPLEGLLSLSEVDARLNDGVGSLAGLNIIQKNGAKLPPGELIVKQGAASWTSHFTQKARVKAMLSEGSSFVLHNMSAINSKIESLISEIEEAFDAQADLHVYVSPKPGSTGYLAHKDEPQHKIYLQLYGSTDWVVYDRGDSRRSMPAAEAEKTLGVDFRATLTPGSVLYMPPGVFHYATNPNTPRVSLSIPFYQVPGALKIDRTHIPIEEWLLKNL